MAKILNGKDLSQHVDSRTQQRAQDFQKQAGRAPRLDVILVGEDPASQVYVRNKVKRCGLVGIHSEEHLCASDITQEELLKIVMSLNEHPGVDGILVQLPLHGHINSSVILEAINPDKDVDGFHPANAGLLACGVPRFVPCTPRGCMHLIHEQHQKIEGLHAVVLGRSTIVGRPMAQLLLMADATVTIAHSRTTQLNDVCRMADILVVAVGREGFVGPDMIKPGATIIDVGINRIVENDRSFLRGDVLFDEVAPIAGAITPVPGGVGPMTIACLLENTVDAAMMRVLKTSVPKL